MFVDVLILKAIDTNWQKYDKDGDGLLNHDTAKKMVYEMFPNLHNYVEKEVIDSEFQSIDTDGDGMVSKKEMITFIHHIAHIW